MSNLIPGTILNRNCYKITRFMAQGGFGITYLAEEIGYFKQSGFGDEEYTAAKYPDKVVIKELYYSEYCQRDDLTGIIHVSNTEKRVEFEKLVYKQLEEGKILRSLKHSNIIHTRDIFKENETAYMVMDYVESTDLEELVKTSGRLEKNRALNYIRQVLTAVSYIHSHKVLHLDITPSNVLIKKKTDEAILIDFGASLTYDGENKVKNNTSKLITGMKRHFAPNEQADIDNLKNFDATFDTYAIGATLYNVLTGCKPPLSSMVSTGREKIIPPSTYCNGEISDYLDAIILKSMAPKFFERFDNVAEFERMLSKDFEYSEKLEIITSKVANGDFEVALNEIELMQKQFLPTGSLIQLQTICSAKLRDHQKEDLKQREYELYFSNGNEWFNNGNYLLAKREFERAASLYQENIEAKEKILICQSHLQTLTPSQNTGPELTQKIEYCKDFKSLEGKNIISYDLSPSEIVPDAKAITESFQKNQNVNFNIVLFTLTSISINILLSLIYVQYFVFRNFDFFTSFDLDGENILAIILLCFTCTLSALFTKYYKRIKGIWLRKLVSTSIFFLIPLILIGSQEISLEAENLEEVKFFFLVPVVVTCFLPPNIIKLRCNIFQLMIVPLIVCLSLEVLILAINLKTDNRYYILETIAEIYGPILIFQFPIFIMFGILFNALYSKGMLSETASKLIASSVFTLLFVLYLLQLKISSTVHSEYLKIYQQHVFVFFLSFIVFVCLVLSRNLPPQNV